MYAKSFILLFLSGCLQLISAQTPLPVTQLLNKPYMKGSTFSLIVKDLKNGQTIYSYDTVREIIPASVMKLVTTATALELLGEDYRYLTTLEYDGKITDGTLKGNLYIKGSGDPTLGSAHLKVAPDEFLEQWITAIQQANINKITGNIIADESIFDTEGLSPKWLGEDRGSYYGAGCYGLSVFDNLYKLSLHTGMPGNRPVIKKSQPDVSFIHFHNYLTTAVVPTDSSFIMGPPFLPERYLYGVVPAYREKYMLKGDIPDPAFFLADYLTKQLKKKGLEIEGLPSSYRILAEKKEWPTGKRYPLITTYSPPLKEIIRITNHVSHNLYADALLKTLGLRYQPTEKEVLSSFGKGIRTVREHWNKKEFDISSFWMDDGSGLSITDKLTAGFMGELLVYMATRSPASDPFMASFPAAGQEGSVRNFLKGTRLQGKAFLKSGGMSRVKNYAGYILLDKDHQYAVAVFANNYACNGKEITRALEELLLSLFVTP